MSLKTDIENAVIAALQPLTLEGGGALRFLGPYAGGVSASGVLLESLQLPAVLIAYAGSTYRPGPLLSLQEEVSFNLIAACRPGSQPDAFEVLEDVRDKICGGTLGLTIKPLRLLREYPVSMTKHLVVVSAIYSAEAAAPLPLQEQEA